MLVSADFVNSTHGSLGCRTCHGGQEGILEKDAAHKEIVVDPSMGDASVCRNCHAEMVAAVRKSLHATQTGYFTAFAARSGESADDSTFQKMFKLPWNLRPMPRKPAQGGWGRTDPWA